LRRTHTCCRGRTPPAAGPTPRPRPARRLDGPGGSRCRVVRASGAAACDPPSSTGPDPRFCRRDVGAAADLRCPAEHRRTHEPGAPDAAGASLSSDQQACAHRSPRPGQGARCGFRAASSAETRVVDSEDDRCARSEPRQEVTWAHAAPPSLPPSRPRRGRTDAVRRLAAAAAEAAEVGPEAGPEARPTHRQASASTRRRSAASADI